MTVDTDSQSVSPEPSGTKQFSRVSRKETRHGTLLAFFAMTFAIYDFILFGTVLPDIQNHFGWTNAQATGVNTLVSIGGAIVLFVVGGMVVDKIGRRKGMMVTVAGTAVGSALTAVAPNTASLVAIRSISGLGLAEQGVNATYLNELYAVTENEKIKRHRGFTYSFVQSGFPLGTVLAAAFAAALLPLIGWRWLFLVATFPALLLIWMRRHLKETPQFKLEQELRQLRKEGRDREADLRASEYGLSRRKRGVPIAEIFRGDALRTTISLSFSWFLNWFGIMTFSVLGTSVLSLGKGIELAQAFIYTVVINLVGFVGYLIHGWFGDRFGRRNVIGVGWIISGVVFAIMLLGAENTAAVVTLYAIGMFFLIGPYSALLFYNGESYPTHCRSTGVNFLNAISQIGGITASLLLTVLLSQNTAWSTAAFLVGAIGTFVSGFVIFTSRNVPVLKG